MVSAFMDNEGFRSTQMWDNRILPKDMIRETFTDSILNLTLTEDFIPSYAPSHVPERPVQLWRIHEAVCPRDFMERSGWNPLGTAVFKTVSPGRKILHHQAWLRGEKSRWGLSELREVAGKPFPLWCVTRHSSGCPHREFPLVSQEWYF